MHRALILLEAKRRVGKFLRSAETLNIKDSYEHQGILAMSVGERVEAGVEHSADIDLDIVTGRKLLAGLERLIDDELSDLGASE